MDKNYILHKYLNSSATEEEIELLKDDPEFSSYIKIAEATTGFEAPLFKEAENRQRISQNIDGNKQKVRHLFPMKQLLRIAAVIALIVASYVFLNSGTASFSTEVAQREEFFLPDNSEVVLNAMSQISYNKKEWNSDRNLTLNGEAYFKVKKGKKFSVETSQGVVSVLGTQFNVFSRGSRFYVKCFEGLVSVAFNDTLVKVPAGNYLKIEQDRFISFESTNDSSPSWVAFESTFKNSDLETVLEELQRQYDIEINHKIITEKKFTGSFTHKDLNVALRSICEPLQLDFKIANNEVMLYARNSN